MSRRVPSRRPGWEAAGRSSARATGAAANRRRTQAGQSTAAGGCWCGGGPARWQNRARARGSGDGRERNARGSDGHTRAAARLAHAAVSCLGDDRDRRPQHAEQRRQQVDGRLAEEWPKAARGLADALARDSDAARAQVLELRSQRLDEVCVELRRKVRQPAGAAEQQPVQPAHRARALLPHAIRLALRLAQLARNLAQLAHRLVR
eukprot:7378967-Prymnesium_polylepis.1